MAFRPFQNMDLSLGNLQDEMNRLFQRTWHTGVSTGPLDGQQWAPLIDVYEHENHYTLYVELPGLEPGAIEVTHVGHTLTIRGEKTQPAGVAESDRAICKERGFGTFCRSVELPSDSDVEQLTAKSHAGVLAITIPKSESSKPKAVKIEIEE